MVILVNTGGSIKISKMPAKQQGVIPRGLITGVRKHVTIQALMMFKNFGKAQGLQI